MRLVSALLSSILSNKHRLKRLKSYCRPSLKTLCLHLLLDLNHGKTLGGINRCDYYVFPQQQPTIPRGIKRRCQMTKTRLLLSTSSASVTLRSDVLIHQAAQSTFAPI